MLMCETLSTDQPRTPRVRLLLAGLLMLAATTIGCASSDANPSDATAETAETDSGSSTGTSAADTAALDDQMIELAANVVRHLSIDERPVVCVADFVTLEGEDSAFGRYVADELTVTLLDTGKVTVVERALLQKALDELNLNATDVVDPEHAQQVGRVVGADCVATGTVTDRSVDVKVNARLIDTEKSTVLSGGSVVVNRSSVEAVENPGAPDASGDASGAGTDPASGDGASSGSTGNGNGGSTGNPGSPGTGGSGRSGSSASSRRAIPDGHESPGAAWKAAIQGLATRTPALFMSAVRDEDQYLVTPTSVSAMRNRLQTLRPKLEGVRVTGSSAVGFLRLRDGSREDIRFERQNGRWYIVLRDLKLHARADNRTPDRRTPTPRRNPRIRNNR